MVTAPERFFAPNFQSVLDKLQVKLLAIDEAHCISQWGHDFRPEYARLGEVRKLLGEPTTIALTATATEDVRSEIVEKLGLRRPKIYITGFDRPNLRYESRKLTAGEKDRELLRLQEELQKEATLLSEHFDEVELKPGTKVRRVTLKVLVPRIVTMSIPWPWPWRGRTSRGGWAVCWRSC